MFARAGWREWTTRMPHAPSYLDARDLRIHEERPREGTSILVVSGDADLHSAPELRERLRMAVDGGATNVVLDLSGVTFIDSTSLGVLLGTMRRLRELDGQMRLVVPRPEVRRIFELTLLDRVFPLDESRDDAVEALAAEAG
jgi:anti-sigma B factor antagonist